VTRKDKVRLAGVIGWPVSHSRSPRLHGYWLNRLGIAGSFVPLAVHPDDLRDVIKALPKMGFAGVNLTVPHKETALPLMDRLDDAARRIGAVNTVVFEKDGSASGYNTDAFGFMENLRRSAPDWNPAAGPAVVLGAGGAARAVIVALLDAGVPAILLANRTVSRAETVIAAIPGPVSVAWRDRSQALADANLLVNTTILGQTGQPPLDIDLAKLPKQALVTDIVYAPLETGLLHQAKLRGNRTVDGLGMLLWQAVPGFEAWFKHKPEVTADLRSYVLGDS